MRPLSAATSTPSSMVLKSFSRNERSRASRCTIVCRPSLSRRPMRPRTLSRKLDLGAGTAAQNHFFFLNHHQVRAYELELPFGETAQHLPLRTNDLAQVEHFLLDLDDPVEQPRRGILHH